jgi:hypothetical protein
VTFAINSPISAWVEVPELPAGAYDVALYDYKQEVDRLPHALTVLPAAAPIPSVEMEISGTFKGLNETSARQFEPGVKLVKGDVVAEVLRVGTPQPSVLRMVAGTSMLSMPLTGQLELPASLRVHCYTEVMGDALVRCMVPGPLRGAPVAPDSMLTLPAAGGWVNFQISTAALTTAPSVVTLRVHFTTAPEVAAMVKAGDLDANAVAYAIRAKVASVSALGAGGTAFDATLNVPAALGPTGWVYNSQALKAGLPFRFETVSYVISGQVIGITVPERGQAR